MMTGFEEKTKMQGLKSGKPLLTWQLAESLWESIGLATCNARERRTTRSQSQVLSRVSWLIGEHVLYREARGSGT